LSAGARNWQTRMRRGLADTGEMLGGPVLKKALAFMNPSDEDVAGAKQAVQQGGPLADVTQMAGDIGSNMLLAPYKTAQGISQLPQALSAIMPMLKQSAYNAAVVPREDKAVAGAVGGAAPAVAPAVASLITGPLKKLITPEAKVLQKAGVDVSPSVAITGEDQQGFPAFASAVARTLRDKASWIPGMGDVITQRNNKMLSQGAVAKINEVLKPLNGTIDTNLPPRQALDKAEEVIDRAYTEAKSKLFLNPQTPIARPMTIEPREPGVPPGVISQSRPKAFFYEIVQHFEDETPLLGERGVKAMRDTVEKLIFKPLRHAHDTNTVISGRVWKEIDSALNKLSDDALAKSTDPESVALGKGFKALQDGWYHIAEESTPGAKVLVRQADEAFSRLQPVAKAAESVMSGPWTPKRMHSVNTRAGIEPSELDRALEVGLGDLPFKRGTAGGAASSGMAAAKMTGLAGVGEAAQMFGMHGPDATTVLPILGAAAAGTYGMGSKPGMAYLQHGINPVLERGQKLAELLRLKKPSTYDEAMMDEFIRRMTQQGIAEAGRK
jgi:hypothetical protein